MFGQVLACCHEKSSTLHGVCSMEHICGVCGFALVVGDVGGLPELDFKHVLRVGYGGDGGFIYGL